MALTKGMQAPDFTLTDSEGKSFHLYRALKNNKVILFFYPKNFTAGCTREACSFRDAYSFFKDQGVEVAGISTDDNTSHQLFRNTHQLPYHLLSDKGGKVSRQYGAISWFGILHKRLTLLVGQDGIIEAVFDNLIFAEKHVREMKKSVSESTSE